MLTSSRHALVVSYLALFLAFSGTAYAITVDGGDVVNGSLTGRDIKAGSVPENDLAFNAVGVADIGMSTVFTEDPLTFAPKDGPVAIAGVDATVPKGFDALYGSATFSISNESASPARIEVRPYIDGLPHGANHHFVSVLPPGAIEMETVTISCNGFIPGTHHVELRIEVLEGEAVTVTQREWHVTPVPESL